MIHGETLKIFIIATAVWISSFQVAVMLIDNRFWKDALIISSIVLLLCVFLGLIVSLIV